MQIGIIGYKGKMGQALLNVCDGKDIAGLHSRSEDERIDNGILITSSYAKLVKKCNVVIDFSRPQSSIAVIRQCVQYGKSIVCGTTGFTQAEMDELQTAAEKIKIFYSSNMSLGIAILSNIMTSAIDAFKRNNLSPEVSILEHHHKHKVDKPSGTAISLSKQIENNDIIPDIVSLRYGKNVGQHEVIISTDMEVLTLQHQATDRHVFAKGAIAAAKFLLQQKQNGLYTMSDIIK